MNVIETLKKANDASINSNEIHPSEFFSDKIFEKAKLRLKTIILKSITKDIEVLIKNELLRNKSTLADKSSDDIYRKGINMLREELKSKILSSETLNYKRNKSKVNLSSAHSSCMCRSKANLLPGNNSVALEDVYDNNDEITDTNEEIFIPNKININDNDAFKNPCKANLIK